MHVLERVLKSIHFISNPKIYIFISEYDGYDYSYTQDTIPSTATNYGYNAGNKSWEVPKNTATDTIIAKINKRLDMLSQLETESQVQDTYQDNRYLLECWSKQEE